MVSRLGYPLEQVNALFSSTIEYLQEAINNRFDRVVGSLNNGPFSPSGTQQRLHKCTQDLLGLALFKIQGRWYVNLRGDLISMTFKHLRGPRGPANLHMR
jgi:hypothetical protein